MDDQGLPGLILPGEIAHRRVQAEHRIERQGVGNGQLAAQIGIVRIADRRDGGQAVEGAAQDYGHKARVTRAGGTADGGDKAAEAGCGPKGG